MNYLVYDINRIKNQLCKNPLNKIYQEKFLKYKKICSIGLFITYLTSPAIAGTMGNVHIAEQHPWSMTGSLGYTFYENMYKDDGQTVLGRFAISRDLISSKYSSLGLEVGVQSGNTMRFFPSQEAIDALGGLPIQTTLKPLVDVLATLKTCSFSMLAASLQVKGGIAYRHWQFNDRSSIGNKSQIAGEVQAGLGFDVSSRANINIFYQGIYGSDPDFIYNATSKIGRVANIPIQQGILLGLTFTV